MADRIKILGFGGSILQSGRPHEIYYHPKHEFVAKLFGLMNRFEGVVEGGSVEIPLGKIRAKGMGEGRKVEVLVRPEGVLLDSGSGEDFGGGAPVEIISTHLLGHDNIVRVRLSDDSGDSGGVREEEKELYVRVHHTFEPELSKQITAGVDPEYAFIFPLDDLGGVAGAGYTGSSQPEAAE